MDDADRVTPHMCRTDGGPVLCYCQRAEDHDDGPADEPAKEGDTNG